jgi:hypothetical protein
MARDPGHLEELMSEATAMVRRAEFSTADSHPELVAGYRDDGSLSLYLGEDRVYQFDPQGRLKRAFVDGLLYRTQGSTLAQLTRDRSPDDHVGLLRHDLDDDQLAVFRSAMTGTLAGVLEDLDLSRLNQSAVVPESADVATELVVSLELVLATTQWLAPRFVGKR